MTVRRDAIDAAGLAIGGLLAMAAAVGIGRFIYTPILPPMTESLGLTKAAAGLIASANFLGYLAGALGAVPPWPWLARAPRRALILALVVSALTTVAMGVASGMPAFLLLRFVGGAASALVLVMASSLVLERLQAQGRAGLSSMHFAGVGFGIVASALSTWVLSGFQFGWRSQWIAGGVLALVALVAAARLIPTPAPAAARPQTSAARAQAPFVRLAMLALAYGCFGFGYVITTTFLVAIVRGSAAARPYEPVFWLVLGLAAIPSVAFWLAIGRRVGMSMAFAIACVAEAVGVWASVGSGSVAALLAASALLGGTFMGLTALGLMAARALAPATQRASLAVLTAAFGVGQVAGPIVAGYGYDRTGSFAMPSWLAIAALLLAAGLGVMISRGETRSA